MTYLTTLFHVKMSKSTNMSAFSATKNAPRPAIWYHKLPCCFPDTLGNIIDAMQSKRSRPKVTEKLMEMGLVTDKSELYKKRKKGGEDGKSRSRKKKSRNESDDDDEAYWNPEPSGAPSQSQEEGRIVLCLYDSDVTFPVE